MVKCRQWNDWNLTYIMYIMYMQTGLVRYYLSTHRYSLSLSYSYIPYRLPAAVCLEHGYRTLLRGGAVAVYLTLGRYVWFQSEAAT
ncbi:hypothetical protein F4859DRAFT_458167 [Xylaria cf. heliscus]|nr:hypothetical protein F4859DRAFT_458167 [Xylaria cf. heliscus]